MSHVPDKSSSDPVVPLKPRRWDVAVDGETLFSLDDIMGVNQHVYELRKMHVPANAPAVKGISEHALPDHVRKCQKDVDEWDGTPGSLLVQMTRLASDLNSFAADSLEALDQLEETSQTIEHGFESLSDAEKNGLRLDMDGIFSTLYEDTQANEGRAQQLSDRLGAFARLLEADSVTAEDLREKYQDYIADKETEITDWERTHGMEPSGDLLKDLQDKITAIADIIKQKEAEYIAAAAGAGTAGAMSVNPLLWIISIPGCIIGSVFAGLIGNELATLRDDIAAVLEKLGTARELNTLKIWFDSQRQTFKDLKDHLDASQEHVNNLRGQWQTLANDLHQLIGDTGKLTLLKPEGWLKPISSFRKRTTARLYDKVGRDTAVFQKLAFQKPKVEELAA